MSRTAANIEIIYRTSTYWKVNPNHRFYLPGDGTSLVFLEPLAWMITSVDPEPPLAFKGAVRAAMERPRCPDPLRSNIRAAPARSPVSER